MASYFFKLNLEQSGLKDFFPILFKRISSELCQQLFTGDLLIFTGNNKNIGQIIFAKIKESGFSIEITTEEETKKFSESSAVIFPYPEKEQIYDIINFHFSPNPAELKIFSAEIITQNNENISFINPEICRICQKENPQESGFCIYCGWIFPKRDFIQNYGLKVSEIKDKSVILKLAKYLQKHSEQKNLKELLDCLSCLPTIFTLSASPQRIIELTEILDKYHVTYEVFPGESLRLDKILSHFVEHGTLDLGVIKKNDTYFDPLIMEKATECLRKTVSENLKKTISNCLYEALKIIEHLKSFESQNSGLFENIETEIDALLNNFFHFVERADSLSNYLSEKYPEKLNQEIHQLKKHCEQSNDKFIRKNYREALEMKERELEEILRAKNNLEIVKSLLFSIHSTLSSVRAKITGISNQDLSQNRGNREELKKISENLTLRLNSIQEVLDLGS